MKASTHTEVYRRFEGKLSATRWRWVPLWRAQVRTAAKKKLPLVLLLAPVVIATVIFSFVVYLRFALLAGEPPSALGGPGSSIFTSIMTSRAKEWIQVREQIVGFHLATNMFSLLLMAWYGAGLIAEDKRMGAHLLYFARPLTRVDYLIAKFLTVAFFGALGAVVPGIVICTVATFASPSWSFLKLESDVVWATLGFGTGWVIVISSLTLTVSSLASRKTFALVGGFGYFLLMEAIAGLLWRSELQALGLLRSFGRIAHWMFGLRGDGPRMSLDSAVVAVVASVLIAWTITWLRVKRLEVVA